MMEKKFIAESVIGGVVITLVSFLYNSTPGGGLVGATWYGFPLTWIRYLVVNTQQYSPWAIDYAGLIADIIIWAMVVAVVLFLVKGRSSPRTKA
ncbi:MAG: hypothetical protein KGH57_03530 [Candidatus Micrarchaeota archaeon]|nr:hypothetical protein [Candidatus Micrarchaeota archaeon]